MSLKATHILTFGKHKNQTIGHVAFVDPQYIVWLSENNILDIDSSIIEQCFDIIMEDDGSPDIGDLHF